MIWSFESGWWKTAPLHGTCRGLAAFIACPGPSFADVDASSLCGAGRVVIGINSTYPRLRPDFWMGMDAPDNYDQALCREAFPKVFRGSYGELSWLGRALKFAPRSLFADVSDAAGFLEYTASSHFHWGRSTFFVALQFALWLGCRHIHLVGADFDNSQQDYADGTYLTPDQRASNARLYSQSLPRLRDLSQQLALEEHGASVVSCSPSSRANDFLPFTPLADALACVEASVQHGRLKNHVMATTEA